LRQIAGLVKPGGWVIAQEPLTRPLPRSFPDFDAVGAAWGLMTELMERSGAPPGVAEQLPRWAAAAGLEVVRMDGSFSFGPPEAYFDLYASALTAIRERAVSTGLTTGEDIDTLVDSLTAAQPAVYDWVTSPPYLDLTLRKPA
jgi:hypothetical protein